MLQERHRQLPSCQHGRLMSRQLLSAAVCRSHTASYRLTYITSFWQHHSPLTCAGTPAASPRRLLSCCMSDRAEGRSRLCAPSRSAAGGVFRICSIGCRTKATACCSTKERTCTQQRPASGPGTGAHAVFATGACTATDTVSQLPVLAAFDGLSAVSCSLQKSASSQQQPHCTVNAGQQKLV